MFRRGCATRRRLAVAFLFAVTTAVAASAKAAPVGPVAVSFENDHLRYAIGADGRNAHFVDKRTGKDYCDPKRNAAFARVKIGKQEHGATSVSGDAKRIRVAFGKSGVTAVMRATVHNRHLVLEVVSLEGKGVESFVFLDVPLTQETTAKDAFVGCALALNLRTNVAGIPQPSTQLRATCYSRFGFPGAQVALVGCPQSVLRDVLKEVVLAAPDLPHSKVGGPWALDAEINQGSYLFNFGGLSEETVDDWIKMARDVGINQIDFHGGGSFRFGDCWPNPKTYPNGLASLKAVVDRLHDAGISAGLHTYAFFINKKCPWVTPIPDPRLAKDATFTLAGSLTTDAATVPVAESTKDMSTTTGFFVRNSVTLQIDDELITYAGISKEAPYAFTQCKRGAYGTRATGHEAGAKVHHLKECFGLFVPDADSTLLTEVAARTAETFNECGFDMMYLDALDGEDILGGRENGWHYGSKFVFELWTRMNKPGPMEMSTFHHHLWYVRGRMGAWDHPSRSHKRFIDIHCQANASLRRQFLPGHLGWWAVKTWTGPQGEPTFADDIEYLCGKCIGNDVGFSVMGVNPGNVTKVPAFGRLAAIMKQYEALRHAGTFDETVKAELRDPGKEFTLYQEPDGRWSFRRMHYAKHKVVGLDEWSSTWTTENPFAKQPLGLRIEALMSAGPYDAPTNLVLADFADAKRFKDRATAAGVTVELDKATTPAKAGNFSGVLRASNTAKVGRKAAWAKVGKTFGPVVDMSKHEAMGVWVHGDGGGQVLNLQLTCPQHVVAGIGEHYIIVDFEGWRYFELIEPEGERYAQYSWPYGGAYAIYREHVNHKHVERLSLLYNNLPEKKQTTCYLSPIKALPLVKAKLKHPAITVNGKKIVFPVEMESGSYLEFRSQADCKLYGPKGELLSEVKPQGDVPVLEHGRNRAAFSCEGPTDVSARAKVTVICQGDPI